MTASVTCKRCGQVWARDPALEVACPRGQCGALAGERCRRPSGHEGPLIDFHRERLQRAFAQGYEPPCPGEPATLPAEAPRPPKQQDRGAAAVRSRHPLPQATLWLAS